MFACQHNFECVSFCLRKMKVRTLVRTHCCSCWCLIYIAGLFWSVTLCYWDFTYKNCGEKIWFQKEDLRKTASLVILLCLACSPVAILYNLVMIIKLFRVILKPNHCCDMPVMLPDPVPWQFKPQREFSGYFLVCSGVISDLFQIMGVALYYMTRSLIFWFVQDLVNWKQAKHKNFCLRVSYSSPRTGKTLNMLNIS